MTAEGLRPVSLELLGQSGEEWRLLEIAAAWQASLSLPRTVPCESEKALVCLSAPAPSATRR
jgi:hypothetical protein